jgi:hypothetical protein
MATSANVAPALANMRSTFKQFESILSQMSLAAGAGAGDVNGDSAASSSSSSSSSSSQLTPEAALASLQQDLAAATSADEYLEVFGNTFGLTDEYGQPQTLRLSRRFIRGGGAGGGADGSSRDSLPSDDQVQRDMERDVVVINGVQYVGAREKLGGLRKQLASRILDESREGELDGDQVDGITMELLRVACRTTSSGDGLEVVHRLCGCPAHVLFAAASDVLSPISIGISVGAWPQVGACGGRVGGGKGGG